MTIGKPFKKGQSGNPGGRPKVIAEVKELAREHTGAAIETLVSIMSNPKAAPAARVSAANALLDRGYGKPPQHITGEGGPSFVVRLPEPAKNAKEWQATVNKPMLISQPLADDGPASDNPLDTKTMLTTSRHSGDMGCSMGWRNEPHAEPSRGHQNWGVGGDCS